MRMQKGKVGNDAGKASQKKSKVMKATVILGPTPDPPPPAPSPAPQPPVPLPEPKPPMPPDLPYGTDKIYNIPLLKIRVAPQVRSHVTTTEAPFLALKESIRERGVLSPVILIREVVDGFLLVSGERRYWACESLNMEMTPAPMPCVFGPISEASGRCGSGSTAGQTLPSRTSTGCWTRLPTLRNSSSR